MFLQHLLENHNIGLKPSDFYPFHLGGRDLFKSWDLSKVNAGLNLFGTEP